MDVRRRATDLSDAERDLFLEALIRLKVHPAPGGPAGLSVYDQYVALHRAVMAVITPGAQPGETVNYGHWNIGFCA
jgi:tyrosinase